MNSFGLKISNLRVGYSRDKAINQKPWSLTVPEKKLVAVIGPNGSGKTSFLRAVMGDTTCLSGEIHIHGEKKSVQSWKVKEISRCFSYLPQESYFDSLQESGAFLKLAFLPRLGLLGDLMTQDREAFERFSDDFDLKEHLKKRLEDLSSGERQRVFLGRALLQPCKIALLDEPTNHLDPNVVEKTWRFLSRAKESKTILVATHDLAQVERHCDYVIVFSKEDLIFSGAVTEYRSQGIKQQVFPLTD